MMDYFKLLQEIKNRYEHKVFLIIDEKSYTYGQIYKESKLLGEKIKNKSQLNNTKECNKEKNIRESIKNNIFIYSDDFYFQIIAFFAINASKNIPIILHHDLPKETFQKIAIGNNIKYVITDEDLSFNDLKQMKVHIDICENLKEIFLYNTNARANNIITNSEVCMGALTSGSTGVPKILYRTYESWAAFFETQNEIFKINSDSRLFLNGSLSFTGNLNTIMSVLYEGGTIVSITKFHCRSWGFTIREHKVTNIYLVPTKLKVLNKFLKRPLKDVKSIFTGSELLFKNIAEDLKKNFPNSEIILYYGASELNYITYLNYEELCSKPLSVGRPFPNVDVLIKDGFIYVNTKYHVEGFLSPCTVYDVGHIDEDGYLIFDGRKDNVINKCGIKVNGIKIENELKKITEIDDAVVVGYDDNKKGREIAAFVVINKEITKEHIIKTLKKNLMIAEIPKKITFLKSMPLNSSGKIDRIKLNVKYEI